MLGKTKKLTTMPTSPNSICPKCSTPIAAGAPQGLCPKCVLLGAATSAKPRATEPKAPSPQEIAPHFPELEVLELIGVGGMGAVYKARQTKLGRLVALKILSNSLAEDAEFLERFDREARVLGRLNHPGIVTIFNSGMAGPCAYLLMEFVDGVNLRQAMQSGGFTPREALAVTQEICSALEYAHGQGILHRDIKPENILIDSAGRVKIADFGIAKLVGDQGPDHATLTVRGAILGSMSYMAPEQFDAPGDVDQRADIYSLGVVLYELLTGELPRGRFGPPSDKSGADARIDEIVMRTLERERDARFQNVHQMKTQVDAATQPGVAAPPASEPTPTKKTARFANASLVCTILGLALAFVPCTVFFHNLTRQSERGAMPQNGSSIAIMPILFLIGIIVLPGTLLGMRALREIRGSGGKLAGLTRSSFAVLTWPTLIFAPLALASFTTISADSGVATVWRILLGTLLIATCALGVVTFRRFIRWTSNSLPAAPGISAHVRRFAATAAVAAVCVFAYVREERATRKSFLEPTGTRWTIEMEILPRKMMDFRVVRVDIAGKETALGVEGTITAPVDRNVHAKFTVTTTERWKGSPRQKIEVSYAVPSGDTYTRSVFLDEHWKFTTSGTGRSQMFSMKQQRIEIATRSNWLGEKVETLYLETIASEHTAPAPAVEKQP